MPGAGYRHQRIAYSIEAALHRFEEASGLGVTVSAPYEECWVVRPDARAVEVLRLTAGGPESLAAFDETQTLVSRVFPGLSSPVAEVFRP